MDNVRIIIENNSEKLPNLIKEVNNLKKNQKTLEEKLNVVPGMQREEDKTESGFNILQPSLKPSESDIGKGESNIRSKLARQDSTLSELNFRLGDLESLVNSIDPRNLHAIIRGIAELVIHEESQNVVLTIDSMRNKEKRNDQLVSILKEELKIMDDRLTQDVSRRSEKRDLYLAKSQINKRVFVFDIIVNFP